MLKRVVITGLGMVTPLADGVEETWSRLIDGQSGISKIEKFDTSDLAAKIAGTIPRGDGTNGTFNPDDYMPPKDQKKVDDFIIYEIELRKNPTLIYFLSEEKKERIIRYLKTIRVGEEMISE